MESSSTSSWKSTTGLKLSKELGIGREALITSSTRELVEFYWTNRKRFLGGYLGLSSKLNRNDVYKVKQLLASLNTNKDELEIINLARLIEGLSPALPAG